METIAVLQCKKCQLVIQPDESVIAIYFGVPATGEIDEITWHARCCPPIIREYVPPARDGSSLES